jgi:drug/metabolite transporter (DMT)-like permease
LSEKKPPAKPAWYKNTYFWIAGMLFLIGVWGLPFLGGDRAVRDPGQRPESNLWLLYLLAGLVMLVNGWLSHRQTVQHYEEETRG